MKIFQRLSIILKKLGLLLTFICGIYNTFGNTTASGSVSQLFAFTAREYDSETGMYFYRARYYDPKADRFITKDPISFAGGDVNLYNYVWNNPVKWIDPLGLMGWLRGTPIEKLEKSNEIKEQLTTIVGIVGTIRTNPKADPRPLMPDASSALINLMSGLSKSRACMDMLKTQDCQVFNRMENVCRADMLPYRAKTMTDYSGAATETIYDYLVAAKREKVCCGK